MAKKISNKDIFEGNIFKPAAENAQNLNDELKKLIKGFGSLADVIKNELPKGEIKTFEQLKEATQNVTKLDEAFKGYTKTEQERLKVEKQLLAIEQQQAKVENQKIKNIAEEEKVKQQTIKTNIILEKEKERQAKISAKEEKAAKELNSEYTKQSRRLNELRKEYKDLVLSQGRSAEGAKELLEEIQELDKTLKEVDAEVGQFQRNVGNYPKVTETAKRGIGSLSGFLLGTFTASLQKSREEGRQYSETLEKVTNSVGLLSIAIVQFVTEKALPAIGIFINKSQNFFNTLIIKLKETQKEFLEFIPEDFRTDAIAEKISSLKSEINDLNTSTKENNKNIQDYSKIIDESKNPFDGLINRINESNSVLGEFLESQDRAIDLTAKLTLEIAKLTAEEELLQGIADDATKSFAEREEAIRGVLDIQQERAGLELRIAEEEVRIAKLAIENDFIRKNLQEEFNALAKQGAIDNLQFLENKRFADAIGIENLERLKEATLGLTEAQGTQAKAEQDALRTTSELQQDRLEKDLDILIDGFDNQKTINERRIADEKKTFDDRQKILDETAKLGESAFNTQVETIQKLTDQQIDANDLLAESDAIALNQKIRSLGLSEVIEGRLLEIIRERRVVIEDLTEAERDLNQARLESAQAIAESEQNIEQDNLALKTELLERELENEELVAEERKRIINDIYDTQKEAIEDQAEFDKQAAKETITDADELAAKLEEIESKKNNDIIRLEKETQDQITDIQEEAFQERLDKGLEFAQKLADATSEALSEAFDEQEKLLDESIARREKSVSNQQKRAELGLENTLAFEKEQLAQAERERVELAERRAKAEEAQALAQAFLNAFQARVKDEPDTAAARALADVVVAKALSETIAGAFATGVEDFKGAGTETSDSNLIRFSKGESVVTAKGTRENKGLVTAMNEGKVAEWFTNNMVLTPQISAADTSSNKGWQTLAGEVADLKSILKNRPTTQTHLDNMGNVLSTTYKNGIRNTVKYLNQRPRI